MTISDRRGQVAADFKRLQELGFTQDDMKKYYEKLPFEGGGVSEEEKAFREMIVGRNLSDRDAVFLRKLLEDCDPR